MCGIAGILGKKLSESTITELQKSLQHRGPNNFGSFIDYETEVIQLFHFRLSIIDLSNQANQPFISACGRYVLVFNGEIYNYNKIRLDLVKQGFRFYTNSDTEVLLNSFIHWGISCVNYLEGMFAFSLWDRVNRELYLSRDRFGEKPLYYFHDKNIFSFSSELRSLMTMINISPTLNKNIIPIYLKYQNVPFGNTFINSLYSLKPGHYLILKDQKVITKCYWDLKSQFVNYTNQEKCLTPLMFKDILIDCVSKSLQSDVPLGMFLSGGIDSSILTLIAKKYLGKDISTFTVCFDNKLYQDKTYAKYVANYLNTDHNEIFFDDKAIISVVSEALSDTDNPTADGINTWIISKSVKSAGLTVAISGVGADELFGGYNTFRRLNFFNSFHKYIPSFISKYNNDSSKILAFLGSDSISKAYTYNRTFLDSYWINNLLPNYVESDDVYLNHGLEFENLKPNVFNFTSYMELSCYMSNVLLKDSDQMSMAHSLEIRSPFLNHKILESLQQVDFKHNFSRPKSILYNIFKNDFSEHFWKRPKQGFVMPWNIWLKNELKPMADSLFDAALKQGIFDRDGLIKLKTSFDNNKISWSRYWLILSLTSWVEKNKISY